jgi:hypothetical protein
MITIFLLCKYFKPATTSLAHVCSKSAKGAKSNSSTKIEMDKIFSAECKDLFQLQTGEDRSKNTPSLLKIQGTGLCSCGLLYRSTVRLLSLNEISIMSMDSTLFFLATTFLVFLCILLGIRTKTYRNPTYFLQSRSFPSNFGNSGSFFCLSFQTCWDFKARSYFVPFWREIVVLVRVLLIESSPRFANRVQSAFY